MVGRSHGLSTRGLWTLLEWVRRSERGLEQALGNAQAGLEQASGEERLTGPLIGAMWMMAGAQQALQVVQSRMEELLSLRPIERRFLRLLRDRGQGDEVIAAQEELARELSASRRAVVNATERLEGWGMIRVTRRGRGRGRKNGYRLVETEEAGQELQWFIAGFQRGSEEGGGGERASPEKGRDEGKNQDR